MAYPNVEAAYGLRPVNRLDGLPYAGAVRHMPIAAQYATGIGFGEPVKRIAGGTIQVAGNGDKPIGVFVGCTFTDPVSKQKVFSQQWPASTDSPDAMAYVVDDPDAVFRVAVLNTGDATEVTGLTAAKVGGNVKMMGLGAVNTATGNSTAGLDDDTVASTAGHPLRIVDIVPESATSDSPPKYQEVLVKINNHQYANTTGVA